MFFGTDEDGNRVNAVDANKDRKYFCPACKAPLILKQGDIVQWHFAHEHDTGCDAFTENKMTAWHLRHQQLFPEECREVRLEQDGIIHIADVKCENLIVEYQHSPIDLETFNERTQFYSRFGHLVWVFDVRDKWLDGKIVWITKEPGDLDHGYFKWSHSNKTLGQHDFQSESVDLFLELDNTGWGCLVEWNPNGMRFFNGRRFDHKEFQEYLRNVCRQNKGNGRLQPRWI